jgi:CheY-like chemotaxis protein
MADFHQIEQILVNLIQNACDALSDTAGEKKISIEAFHHINSVFITVADNGPGIPEELQTRIFDPFFTTKGEGRGTGLGLAICRRIAQDHGARLTCASLPGKGAAFTLEIPIVNMSEAASLEGGDAAKKPAPGKKILVVDDEPDIVAMMGRMLESEGQIVFPAFSAPEAIEKLKTEKYDIVICDVEMGPSKGFSVREAMLEMNYEAGFIFTTGNLLNQALLTKLKESRIPFLPKPFDMSELLCAINEALP